MTDNSLEEGIKLKNEIKELEQVAKHLGNSDIDTMSFFSKEHQNRNLIFCWFDDKEMQYRITNKVLQAVESEINLLREKFSKL